MWAVHCRDADYTVWAPPGWLLTAIKVTLHKSNLYHFECQESNSHLGRQEMSQCVACLKKESFGQSTSIWPSGTPSWPRQFSETVALTDHKLDSAININVSSYPPASKKFEISFAGEGVEGEAPRQDSSHQLYCLAPASVSALSPSFCSTQICFCPLLI